MKPLSQLSDDELVMDFTELLIDEREKLVFQLEYILELDRRKLFRHHGSLRSYLVAEHGMEKSQAERKIRIARMMKRIPETKRGLESGKLNFTLLEMAQGCAHQQKLSREETVEILETISGLSCKAAEREIASLYPKDDAEIKDRIRPISEELSEVRFVASQDLLDQLEEIKGLLVHSHPSLSMAELITVLATEYRKRHHPEEKAKRSVKRQSKEVETPAVPRVEPEKKRVPSQVLVHELVLTKGYKCAYVDPQTQKRCDSKHGLEIDHIQAWSLGGETKVSNLRFLCRNHHRRISFLQFGESSRYFRKRE